MMRPPLAAPKTPASMPLPHQLSWSTPERALAKKYALPLCDLHRHFMELFAKNPKLMDELISPDGVHLTDKGNEMAAKYAAPFIAKLLAMPDDAKKDQK